ncbi:MAG: TonB-dependent receptor plug domain-containing protein [Bacteroidia bacterium]|nr:TonB-dependent receptor plug domain-containing protein [Bacteroidia bacterium]
MNLLRISILSLVFLCFCWIQGQAQSYTINGYVKDLSNGESLINATILDEASGKGAITNNFGFFSLKLPQDSVKLKLSYAGFSPKRISFFLKQDTTLNVSLDALTLNSVDIIAEEVEREVDNAQMGAVVVPISQVKLMPALLGEVDVIKAIQLMPGVQSGSEGTTGLYVRGGGPDQNLIMLDGVPLYYVSHLGGFFSVFNADALSSVKLYKGGFPARYGGRLSSILDIRMKEGNLNKFEGEGSIGLISSKLSLQGPIQKGKSSFIISGRRTYIDLLTRPISKIASQGEASVGYYFYDLNGKINHRFSDKDRLYFSFYMGDDKFGGSGKTEDTNYEDEFKLGLSWGNRIGALRWNHVWSKNLFSNVTGTFSRYQLKTSAEGSSKYSDGDTTITDVFGLEYLSRIQDWGGRIDFDYYPSPAHDIKFGIQTTYHTFEPGTIGINQRSNETRVDTNLVSNLDYTWESAIYFEDRIKIGQKFSANLGVHATQYLIDKKTFYTIQPRLSARFALSKNVAFKASYVQMNQFIHLLTNSGTGLPIDLWVPATDKVPSQFSWQAAAGVSASLWQDQYQLTVEGYYKEMTGLIAYKEGNNFFFGGLQSGSWEETVETGGRGESYGAEVLLQKKTGKTTGWIGYTLSWNWRQFPNINEGSRFPYKYDRRHDISIVVSHKFNKRVSVAGTWVFGTGNAITLPTGGYPTLADPTRQGNIRFRDVNGETSPVFYTPFRQIFTDITGYGNGAQVFENGRNGFRMQAYHRLDLGVNFTKEKKWGERTWTIGVYNAYSRLNPFAYYLDGNERFNPDTGQFDSNPTLKKLAIFPIIPSVSYQFKF